MSRTFKDSRRRTGRVVRVHDGGELVGAFEVVTRAGSLAHRARCADYDRASDVAVSWARAGYVVEVEGADGAVLARVLPYEVRR